MKVKRWRVTPESSKVIALDIEVCYDDDDIHTSTINETSGANEWNYGQNDLLSEFCSFPLQIRFGRLSERSELCLFFGCHTDAMKEKLTPMVYSYRPR